MKRKIHYYLPCRTQLQSVACFLCAGRDKTTTGVLLCTSRSFGNRRDDDDDATNVSGA